MWLSVKEYAQLKGVHRETVLEWIARNYLHAERAGPNGHWRIQIEDAQRPLRASSPSSA